MTDTQKEVFKTPVNKIRLFEHGAPGSQNLKLTRKYYTEYMPVSVKKPSAPRLPYTSSVDTWWYW